MKAWDLSLHNSRPGGHHPTPRWHVLNLGSVKGARMCTIAARERIGSEVYNNLI